MYMKKFLLIFALLIGTAHLSAQEEVPSDSIGFSLGSNIKLSGDYMLDMNLLSPPKLPSFNPNLLGPNVTKDYNLLFLLPMQMVLSRTFINSAHHSYGFGMFSSSNYLQSATFQLNDQMRLSTYGQYTLDGKRMPNQSALPWEKNNFMGGMELKFNKNFGIRIEVQQGRNPMYPY